MKEKKIITIKLEDKQQDFLEWDIDEETGEILESRPLQSWLWKGKKIKVKSIQVNKKPKFKNGDQLNYKVEKITRKTKIEKIIHYFGNNINDKFHKSWTDFTVECGITIKRESVSNNINEVTCKKCKKQLAYRLREGIRG